MMTLTILFVVSVFLLAAACLAAPSRPSLSIAPLAGVSGGPADASTVDDARLVSELRAAGGRAGAAGAPVSDFRRRFQVVRTQSPPKIDGLLDEAAWHEAARLDSFLVSQSFNDPSLPRAAADATEAFVLYDDEGLYVGIRAWQDPSTIYTTIKENGWLRPDLDWQTRGEPWANTGTDEVEIVIDPELTMVSHFVFQINPDNVRKKLYMPPARTADGFYKRIDPVEVADDAWNSATSRSDDGWCAEVFIPWESIGFQKIRPAGDKDVFVDMVQDRTVMGFNINRVVHKRHEPSSWSPSKGTMFFRDADHFGLAYFARHEALIEHVESREISSGGGLFDVSLRSRSDSASAHSLTLEISADGATGRSTMPVRLEPGASQTVTLDYKAAGPGRNTAEIRLENEGGRLIDAACFLFDVEPPLEITCLNSILYKGERDMPLQLSLSGAAGADALDVRLLSARKALARVRMDAPADGQITLPVEVDGLSVGEYEIEARLLAGRKTLGSATAPLAVIADPFRRNLTGRAGRASKSQLREPFGALADGEAFEGAPASFEGTLPWLDESMRQNRPILWAITPTADFTSDTVPRPAQLDAPLCAFAAGGEYEAVALAVHALEDLHSPRVEIDGLTGREGEVIPPECIDIRAERPDGFICRPERDADIPAKTSRRYFLSVYVAPGTPAGLYKGEVSFTAEGIARQTRQVRFLVLPFALVDTPLVGSIYGSLDGDVRDRHLAGDLFAHGLDNFTCMRIIDTASIGKVIVHHLLWDLYKPTEENWLGEGAERFKAHLDERVFANMKKLGLKGPIVVEVNYLLRYLPCTGENARLFEEALGRIEALRKKHGLDEFVYHLVDEPSNHFTYDDGRYGRRWGLERVDFFGRVLTRLGLRQYVTINSTGRGFDTAEKMPDRVDIWCPNSISDERQVARWSRPPKQIWLYNFAGDGRVKGAARSTFGFYAHKVRAAGVTIWHHPNYVRREVESGKCWGNAAWEAIREGRDDSRYVATLCEAIESAGHSGGRAAKTAERAEAALDEIVEAYPILTADKVRFERKHDASQWDKWRWTIASWIMKLQAPS